MNPIDLSSRPGAGVPASTSLRGSFSPAGFLELLFERVSLEQLNALNARRHPAGRPVRRLTRGQLLAALLFHYTVSLAGALGEHLFLLLEITMAESALSERRQATP